MDRDEIAAMLQRYNAAAQLDPARACCVTFQLGLTGWDAPPAYREALAALGLRVQATLEEQGGRPILCCREQTVPSVQHVTARWIQLDRVAAAHRMPPVELFWLSALE